jgi:hypothetical protein
MLQHLLDFYRAYPDNLLSVRGARRTGLPTDLTERVAYHRSRQLELLGAAQLFRLSPDAEELLFRLLTEMRVDGLEAVYHEVRLPFPVILIERPTGPDGVTVLGLLTQGEGEIYTQRFLVTGSGLVPNLLVLRSAGLSGELIPSPTQELLRLLTPGDPAGTALEEEARLSRHMLGATVALATLLKHRGMLERAETAAHPRAERRRAEREGRPLPDTRVSVISLGEAGRGQLEAMRDAKAARKGGPRRAHWVRGHFMRNPSGGLSWRMPHIRGAGPLIGQERRVVGGVRD